MQEQYSEINIINTKDLENDFSKEDDMTLDDITNNFSNNEIIKTKEIDDLEL